MYNSNPHRAVDANGGDIHWQNNKIKKKYERSQGEELRNKIIHFKKIEKQWRIRKKEEI